LPAIEGIKNDIPEFGYEDLIGQVSVVNVFASWCIPCRDEHRFLVELGATNSVALYGINQKDAPENARQFLSELGNPFDRIGADFNGRISIDWGVYGVPETFVINPKGIITYKQIGPLNEETYRNGLLPAIEEARNTP
jgi:cytochrome c biogenesis protein CcmG/thiol:disulfide interchange protein DsbE